MSLHMFHTVIVPLLELETTALICISTPMGEDNFYSKMFKMRDQSGSSVQFIDFHWYVMNVRRAPTPQIVRTCGTCYRVGSHLQMRWYVRSTGIIPRTCYENPAMTTESVARFSILYGSTVC